MKWRHHHKNNQLMISARNSLVAGFAEDPVEHQKSKQITSLLLLCCVFGTQLDSFENCVQSPHCMIFCVCVAVCVFVFVCVCVCVSVCACMCVCMYACVSFLSVSFSVSVRLPLSVSLCACASLYVCLCLWPCLWLCLCGNIGNVEAIFKKEKFL